MFSQRSQSRTVVSSIFEQRILSCDALAIQSGNLGFGNPVEFLSCRADGLPAGARPASSAGFRGVEAQAARPLAAADCFAPAEPEVGGAVEPGRERGGARPRAGPRPRAARSGGLSPSAEAGGRAGGAAPPARPA